MDACAIGSFGGGGSDFFEQQISARAIQESRPLFSAIALVLIWGS
jgi:hypothetical protein